MRGNRNFWKLAAVALLITPMLACLASDPGHASHPELSFALLPDAGPLDTLPSAPTHWLATPESPAFPLEPFLSSLPPRGPPLS